ncbi:MAG TPA: DUF222 domain-containing protein [Acidimicrobiales bacterium]|nr:DUF222 domain-containing protein [Acidimicrobiales bacterium]
MDRCRKAARFDVGLGSNDDLRAAVLELESARAAIDATQGHYLAELEARDACDIDLGLSTVSWLCSELRVPRRDAAVRVRVANKLRTELDGVDAALGEGRIGFEHARVLAAANPRVAEVIAGVQDALVAAAQHSPFEIWRRDVAGLVELVDQDGGHDPNDDVSRNRLHLDDVGGATVLRGELVGETALVVEQALEAATDALFRRYRRDHEACPELVIPPRSVVRALALAELVRHGLVENATAGPVVDVTVVLDGDTGAVTTPNGTRVDPHTCGHLLCDPVLHALWRDGPSVPLDLKREVRFATPHQRRVLSVRDGGCVFPGCGARASWCDAHHLEYWEDGGHTDMTNLALLCRHHHGVVHRKGWSMTADPAGGFTFTTPAGRMLTSRRPDPP